MKMQVCEWSNKKHGHMQLGGVVVACYAMEDCISAWKIKHTTEACGFSE